MPEDQNVIFKLQLDTSGYITGVNAAADSTGGKFVAAQRKANDLLIAAKKALEDENAELERLKENLENAQKTNNTAVIADNQRRLDDAIQSQKDLTAEVQKNQQAYDDATKAAADFFATQQKAQVLVQNNVPAPVPNVQQLALPFQEPGAQLSLFDQIPQGVAQAVGETTDQFKALSDQVTELDTELQKLDHTSEEFQQLTAFKDFANSLVDVHAALGLVGDGSEESKAKLIQYRDELQQTTAIMKIYVATLDKSSDAYKTINPLVQQSEAILGIYNESLKQTGDAAKSSEVKHISFRQQLLNLRNELGAMQLAGQDETEQYKKMEIEAGRLTELYRIQQAQLRVLGSQHKALDFGKAAIQGAVAGFQTLGSVEVLFGQDQAELEKITLKLFAAMQLLNGVEELYAVTQRGSTIATLADLAIKKTYTAVTEAAATAAGRFKLALLGTGVGAVLVGLGFLVKKFIDIKEAQDKAAESGKILNNIQKQAVDGYAAQVSNIELLRTKLNDTNLSTQQRIAYADEYNKVAETGNQLDTTQINNLTLINAQLDRQVQLLEQRAIATAAENATTEAASALFKAQADLQKKGVTPELLKQASSDIQKIQKEANDLSLGVGASINEVNIAIDKLTKQGVIDLSKFSKQQVQGIINALVSGDIKVFQQAQIEFDKTAKIASGLLNVTTIKAGSLEEAIQNKNIEINQLKKARLETSQTDTKRLSDLQVQITKAEKELSVLEGKTDTTAVKVENTFQAEFDALTARKAELESQIDTSIVSISEKFQAKLKQELDKIDRLKIPKAKKQILIDLAIRVNEEEKNKAIDDFQQKQVDAVNKVDDQLKSLQDKINTAQVNNLKDQFTKRAAVIDDNQNKEIGDVHKLNDQLLRELDKDKQAGLLNEQQYQEDRRKVIEGSEILIDEITIKYSKQRQELAVQTFTENLKRFDDAVEQITSTADARLAEVVRTQADRFTSGSINFATFQKNVQDQTKVINAQSRNDIIKQRQAEILETELKLDTIRDRTTQAYADLKKKREDLSKELNALEKSDAEADAADVEAKTKGRIDTITGYADAIGSVAQSVIGFWQAVNDAEARALERSITLQQRRVDEALKIADRGNASYLKAETDRLKQLEIERENSARRQLGVDAALQASQILVGITGAIAKIGTGTPAETIADIAIIIGALATGYGLIKQLQTNQPRFKEGTPYVQLGENKPGTDTVPAWLNEGEAVIPTPKNKRYKKAVEAIYHEKIPASVMNEFVTNYVTNNGSPSAKNTTYESFVENVSQVPAKELSQFIEKYKEQEKYKDYKFEERGFFKGILNAPATPAMLTEGEAVIPTGINQLYKPVIKAVYHEKVPAEVMNSFVKGYKTSISEKEFSSLDDRSKLVYTLYNVTKKQFGKAYDKKVVSKIDQKQLKNYTETISTVFNKQSSEKPLMIPEAIRDIVFDAHKVISPFKMDRIRDTTYEKGMMNFVDNFYELKQAPQPNYEHIAAVNEMKMGFDGKMRSVLEQQNELLRQNNEHQKETQHILKTMGISMYIDRNGVAAIAMDAIKQKKIDAKL